MATFFWHPSWGQFQCGHYGIPLIDYLFMTDWLFIHSFFIYNVQHASFTLQHQFLHFFFFKSWSNWKFNDFFHYRVTWNSVPQWKFWQWRVFNKSWPKYDVWWWSDPFLATPFYAMASKPQFSKISEQTEILILETDFIMGGVVVG